MSRISIFKVNTFSSVVIRSVMTSFIPSSSRLLNYVIMSFWFQLRELSTFDESSMVPGVGLVSAALEQPQVW